MADFNPLTLLPGIGFAILGAVALVVGFRSPATAIIGGVGFGFLGVSKVLAPHLPSLLGVWWPVQRLYLIMAIIGFACLLTAFLIAPVPRRSDKQGQ